MKRNSCHRQTDDREHAGLGALPQARRQLCRHLQMEGQVRRHGRFRSQAAEDLRERVVAAESRRPVARRFGVSNGPVRGWSGLGRTGVIHSLFRQNAGGWNEPWRDRSGSILVCGRSDRRLITRRSCPASGSPPCRSEQVPGLVMEATPAKSPSFGNNVSAFGASIVGALVTPHRVWMWLQEAPGFVHHQLDPNRRAIYSDIVIGSAQRPRAGETEIGPI